MLPPQSRRDLPTAASSRRFRAPVAWVAALALTVVAAAAVAQPASQIAKLNKQALEAYDGLNFDQARTNLEEALAVAKREGLENDPSNARTHLNLGMVLIAAFQKTDEGREEFRAALKIQPDISPPAGLFNPEVQTVFDEVKAQAEADAVTAQMAAATSRAAKPKPNAATATEEEGDGEEDGAEEETEAPADSDLEGRFVLSLLGGSGGGVVKGPVEANTDLGGREFEWPGAFALSKAAHLTLSAGYFVSPSLLISVEGRYQFVQGTNTVWTPQCVNGCTPPSSAIAGVARASWHFGSAPFRWFVSGGLGGGRIRHVVPVKIVEQMQEYNDCGPKAAATMRMGEKCVDTVAGGPLFVSPGIGFSYDLGPVFLLGVANVYLGVPTAMFHLDLNVGLGLRI